PRLTPAQAITDFNKTVLHGGNQVKTVYLSVVGTEGRVDFKRFELEGSSDISVSKVYLTGGRNYAGCWPTNGAAKTFTPEAREGDIQLKGSDIKSGRCPSSASNHSLA